MRRALSTLCCAALCVTAGCSVSKNPERGTLSGTAALTGQGDSSGIVVSLAGAATAVTVTRADGHFAFPDLAAGSYTVTAAAPSTIEEEVERSAVITAGLGTATAPIVFSPLGSLSGKATLGSPAGNAGIVVQLVGTPLVATTDDAGAWRFERVPSGPQGVVASLAGRGSAGAQGVVVPYAAEVRAPDLVLVPQEAGPGTIQGKALLVGESHQGTPISLEGPVSGVAVSAGDGSYAFPGLPDGRYRLTARALSALVETISLSVQVNAGAQVGLADFYFAPTGSIRGRATLGQPTGNTGITVGVVGTALAGTTNDSGDYRIDGVPTGLQDLIASRPGRESARLGSVRVRYGTSVAADDLTLGPAAQAQGSLRGRALLEGLGDHRGISVTIAGPASAIALADANGDYAFTALPPGGYAVTASARSTAQAGVTIAVTVGASGPTVAGDLRLTPLGALAGRVTVGGAITGTSGILVSADGTTSHALTDAAGDWVLTGVPLGIHTLRAVLQGSAVASVASPPVRWDAVTPVPSMDLAATGAGTLSGLVHLEGLEHHGGTQVTLDGVVSTVTADDGSWTLTGVPAGIFSLSFSNGEWEERVPSLLTGLSTGAVAFNPSYTFNQPFPAGTEPLVLERASRLMSTYGQPYYYALPTPDGEHILMTKYGNSNREIISLSSKGGAAPTVSRGFDVNQFGTGSTPALSFTPDNAQILVLSDISNTLPVADLRVVSLATGHGVTLAADAYTYSSFAPKLSPDGAHALYLGFHGNSRARVVSVADHSAIDLDPGAFVSYTSQTGSAYYPFSPDGKLLFVPADYASFDQSASPQVVRVDGGPTARLETTCYARAHLEGGQRFTPDSARVLFLGNFSPNGQTGTLFLGDVAGSRCLALGSQVPEFGQHMGPEGNVVFLTGFTFSAPIGQLQFYDVAQDQLRRLDEEVEEFVPLPGGRFVLSYSHPDYVNQARALKLISMNGSVAVSGSVAYSFETAHVSADGKTVFYHGHPADLYTPSPSFTLQVISLTTLTDRAIATGVSQWYYAAIAPDGSKIAYASQKADSSLDAYVSLSVADVATGLGFAVDTNVRGARICTGPYNCGNVPTFSPDGKWLAYVKREDDGNDSLKVVATSGGAPRTVAEEIQLSGPPSFGPDGHTLVFWKFDESGAPALWLADVRDAQISSAPFLAGTSGFSFWTANGALIAQGARSNGYAFAEGLFRIKIP